MFKWLTNIGRNIRNLSSGLANPASWLVNLFGGAESDSGITINGKTALTYSTIFQAVSVIAGDVSQLPVFLIRRDGDNRDRATKHPAYRLMRRRPNDVMTAQTFKMTLMCHALLWGNGYALIERDAAGRPTSLFPLLPDRTWPEVVDGQLIYKSRINNKEEKFPPVDILHIKGLSLDGIAGLSVITLARNSWGLGLAAEQSGGSFFKNNSQPSGVLEVPGKLSVPAADRMRESWNSKHAGSHNAMKLAVMEEGAKFNPISMSNKDSQWIEARQFQRVEVASWFNLPPWKLGADVATSYASLEVQAQAYLNQALMRWLVTWEEELADKLLTEREKLADSHEFKFNTKSLLRGDLKSRNESYQIARMGGWMNANDILAAEDENGIGTDGDEYWRPANMAVVGEDPEPPPPQLLPPVIEPDAEDEDEEPDENNGPTPPTDSLRELVRDRMMRMLAIEQKAIRKACKADNFLDAIDAIYVDDLGRKYHEAVNPVLSVADDVLGWPFPTACSIWNSARYESKRRLADLAGSCVPSALADAVETELATWPARIDETINQLFPEQRGAA